MAVSRFSCGLASSGRVVFGNPVRRVAAAGSASVMQPAGPTARKGTSPGGQLTLPNIRWSLGSFSAGGIDANSDMNGSGGGCQSTRDSAGRRRRRQFPWVENGPCAADQSGVADLRTHRALPPGAATGVGKLGANHTSHKPSGQRLAAIAKYSTDGGADPSAIGCRTAPPGTGRFLLPRRMRPARQKDSRPCHPQDRKTEPVARLIGKPFRDGGPVPHGQDSAGNPSGGYAALTLPWHAAAVSTCHPKDVPCLF